MNEKSDPPSSGRPLPHALQQLGFANENEVGACVWDVASRSAYRGAVSDADFQNFVSEAAAWAIRATRNGKVDSRRHFEAAVLRTIINQANHFWRDRAREEERKDAVGSVRREQQLPHPIEVMIKKEEGAVMQPVVQGAWDSLTPDEREIVHWRMNTALTFGVIAEQLKTSIGTLMPRHFRAIAKLRKYILDRRPDLAPPAADADLADHPSTHHPEHTNGRSRTRRSAPGLRPKKVS